METPTHKVDCFKNRVALEIEWNNKDPFFDRDRNNFRLLFDQRIWRHVGTIHMIMEVPCNVVIESVYGHCT